jgi:cell division septal protein FtsQ
LELVSLVRSVSLEKILPHTLRMRVIEREPLAQLSIARPRPGGGIDWATFFLDAEGYVILPLNPSQCAAGSQNGSNEQLPTITGVSATEIRAGHRVESPQVWAALELIQAFQRSPMQGLADIKRVDVSGAEILAVKTAQGSEITFGLKDPDQQLLRWQSIFDAGQRMNKAIASLDLAVSNSIPATWVDASSVPPVPAKMPKPLRNRNKHV